MRISVTRKVPGQALDILLKSGHEVTVSPVGRPLTPQELLDGVVGVDAILSLLTDKIDGEVMDAAGPQLKVISNYAVGFDNVNIKDATDRGIVVTNTPSEVVNEAVAEMTWAMILSLTRRIVEADEATRRGAYKGWEPDIFLGTSLPGRTLGIVGLGRIGTMVAKRAQGFGVSILYNKRSPDPLAEKELGIKYALMDDLLSSADIISLHCPLTEETCGMVNKAVLAKMKRGAILINTARGPIVKEDDLVESLRSGHLGGAGLDVFENEPNIHPELIGMENVILTPHIASATVEAREEMCQMAVDGLLSTLSGTIPPNIVNKEMWEKRRK
jgi:glyoxylate reductase